MTNDRFHSSEFPAIEWKTYREYFLNGVKFPKDLWQKVVSKKMPFQDILAIKDIDQRTQAMKYGDFREFLKYTNSVLLDKKYHENKNSEYELWKTPVSAGVFRVDAYHCVYQNPYSKEWVMSGVEPGVGEKESVNEAMAWKRELNLEDWMNAVYA